MSKPLTLPSETSVTNKPSATDENNSADYQARHPRIPHEQLDQLLEEIENGRVREIMSAAFSALLSLLQDVPALAKIKPNSGIDPDAMIERFRKEANALIEYIGTVALSAEGLNEELADTLDGVAFALSHDLKRTLNSELKGLGWKSEDAFARGNIAYVSGLLTNCLQQSIITLAQVFDPGLDGGKLFDNYQARLRESLLLCRDLTDMILQAHGCEKDMVENFPKLVKSINCFRGEACSF